MFSSFKGHPALTLVIGERMRSFTYFGMFSNWMLVDKAPSVLVLPLTLSDLFVGKPCHLGNNSPMLNMDGNATHHLNMSLLITYSGLFTS